MSNTHPFAVTEAQFKEISVRMRSTLESLAAGSLGHAQALQVLSQALYSKPYEEVKATVFLSEPVGTEDENNEQGEYARLSPSRCLYCRSENISGGDPEVDGDSAFVPVHCEDCCSQWNEVYRFEGVEDFVEG